MTTVIDAINELIKSANVAQSRGAFSLKEAHDVYVAIDFINSAVTNQPAPPPVAQPETSDSKKKKGDY